MTSTRTLRSVFLRPLSASLLLLPLMAGCQGSPPSDDHVEPLAGGPAYYGQVETLIQDRCVSCHTETGMAPFPLDTYAQAKNSLGAILSSVTDKHMPPWPPSEDSYPLANPRSLTEAEITLLKDWADAGAPEGDVALHHELLLSPDSGLGEPDLLLTPSAPYQLPAASESTEEHYRCFPIDPQLTEDTFLIATNIMPGNSAVVHHVVLYQDPEGESLAQDAADPEPGFSCVGGPGNYASNLGNWVPGDGPDIMPGGSGLRLTKGAYIILQVHYHADVEPTSDLTRAGLYLSNDPDILEADYIRVGNKGFTIPAGAVDYEVTALFPFTTDGVLWGAGGHMHLLGQKVTTELVRKDGTSKMLINIPRWDFGWQGNYFFAQELEVERGDSVRVTCVFDNSEDNPLNPHSPPQDVSFGESTDEEMCVSAIYYVAMGNSLMGEAPLPPY